MTIFGVYKRYPFAVPRRVRFFNLFRIVFLLSFLEKFLILRIQRSRGSNWKKLIPPLYFYRPGSIRIVERDGINFRLDISKQLDHSIYFFSVRDRAWDNLLERLHPDYGIIDVGANIGYLTLQFATRCKKGAVYAFEPDSETFYKLTQNVNLNKFGNIQLFHTALGSATGTGELYRIYESNPGANRILSQKPAASVPSETVPIATLDEYDSKGSFKAVDLIKIDVEGFELFVLEGARNLILKRKPILFIELVDQNLKLQGCSGHSVIDYLVKLDYVIFDAKTMKPLEESDNYYTDILCYPEKTN